MKDKDELIDELSEFFEEYAETDYGEDEAKEKATEKWRLVADILDILSDVCCGDYCPLCAVHEKGDDGCDGCPVMDETGHGDCYGSPFYDALSAIRNARNRVEEEAEFLEDL